MTKKIIYLLISLICGGIASSIVTSFMHNNLVGFVIAVIVTVVVFLYIPSLSRKLLNKGTESINNSKILAKMEAKEEAKEQKLESDVTFMPYVAWKDKRGENNIAHIQYGPVTINPNTGKEFNFVDYLVENQSLFNLDIDLNNFDKVKQLKKAFKVPSGYLSTGAFTPVYALKKCPEYDRFIHLFRDDSFLEIFSPERRTEHQMKIAAFALEHDESPFFDRYIPWDKFVQEVNSGIIGGVHIDRIIVHENAVSGEELAQLNVDPTIISYTSDPS